MKLFPNPITSPSRLDKFQPPLKRSLRKNGRSKSRGRSRLSPLFIRKKNEVATETQEPSSPKVTCFGQVRVRKSKGRASNKHRCCCSWIRKALCCSRFVGKSKPRSFRSIWERWFLFLKVGFRRKAEFVEESIRRESIQSKREETEEEEELEEDKENTEEAGAEVLISSSPPKDALLLMRSKSESYRPSSLANLFWGSPVSVEDSEEIQIPRIIAKQRRDGEEEEEEDEEKKKPTSKNELSCRDSAAESINGSKIEEKLGLCEEEEEIESSLRSSTTNIKSSKIEDERGRNSSSLPIVLRRCKSEPARKSLKFDLPEKKFWNKKKLEFDG